MDERHIGTMEGTFTQPTPIGEGNTIPPTGKAFKMKMVTVGDWNNDGVMDEEYLFLDSQEFMRQIGLGNEATRRRFLPTLGRCAPNRARSGSGAAAEGCSTRSAACAGRG